MSRYLRDAQHHSDKIDHYHKHAGSGGYSQAHYHETKLEELMVRASKSKTGKSCVSFIGNILESVRPKMKEMKDREIDADES
ncbi:MAG: hypothetical protein SH868_18225 [Bythopirellula sp.]|nr:hypothetical protein [Bythopirellula sp.]